MFTARYALCPYITQIKFVFKRLNKLHHHLFLGQVERKNAYLQLFTTLRAEHLRSIYKRSGTTHVPYDWVLWKRVWISATRCHNDVAFSFTEPCGVAIKFQAYIWGHWLPGSVVDKSFSRPPERCIKNNIIACLKSTLNHRSESSSQPHSAMSNLTF